MIAIGLPGAQGNKEGRERSKSPNLLSSISLFSKRGAWLLAASALSCNYFIVGLRDAELLVCC